MTSLNWKWWLSLSVLSGIALVLSLPASVLGSVLSMETNGKFKLVASEGTLWNGQGQPTIGDAALGERISWTWQPKALLKGKLAFDLQLDNGHAKLILGLSSAELQDADLTIAATPLFQLDQRGRAYGLSGQLRLASPNFHYQAGKPAGLLTLDWLNAASSLVPAVNPLGTYRTTLTPAKDGWHLQVASLDGALQINGGGDWQDAQGFSMDIGLRANAGAETALAPFLNQIGAGEANAERRLRFNFR